MPTALRVGRFRFFFYSNENTEPPHIHVESGDAYAKYWLDPIELASSVGYNKMELRIIRELVQEHQDGLREKWREHFAS